MELCIRKPRNSNRKPPEHQSKGLKFIISYYCFDIISVIDTFLLLSFTSTTDTTHGEIRRTNNSTRWSRTCRQTRFTIFDFITFDAFWHKDIQRSFQIPIVLALVNIITLHILLVIHNGQYAPCYNQ